MAHVEFGARYAAAGEGNEVGGDFYDVFDVPEGQWAVAIGDVCGKGPEAAAITGLARNVLRLLGREGIEPAGRAEPAQHGHPRPGRPRPLLHGDHGTVRAIPAGLTVCLTMAGHPPPVLVTKEGRASFVGTSGSLLGVFDDVEVSGDELVLAPGESLVFYTDGVTERRNGDLMFGDDNLLAICEGSAGSSADELAGQIEERVRTFGEQASRDDLAVLVVRATG